MASYLYGADASVAAGAAAGSVVPGIGTAAGGIIGAVVSLFGKKPRNLTVAQMQEAANDDTNTHILQSNASLSDRINAARWIMDRTTDINLKNGGSTHAVVQARNLLVGNGFPEYSTWPTGDPSDTVGPGYTSTVGPGYTSSAKTSPTTAGIAGMFSSANMPTVLLIACVGVGLIYNLTQSKKPRERAFGRSRR